MDKTLFSVLADFTFAQRDYHRGETLDRDKDLSCWGDGRDDALRDLVASGRIELVAPATIGSAHDAEPDPAE